MDYTYKSRATKKTYRLDQISGLTDTERQILKDDLKDAIQGMRQEMYEERYRINEEDKWFKAVSYKVGICTAFMDEIESLESLDFSQIDKVTLAFLRNKLQSLLGFQETDRIFTESRQLAMNRIKSIKS